MYSFFLQEYGLQKRVALLVWYSHEEQLRESESSCESLLNLAKEDREKGTMLDSNEEKFDLVKSLSSQINLLKEEVR